MFLHLSVILFTGGRGFCFSACWDTTPPGTRHPPEQTPPEQTPPWEQTLLGADTPCSRPPPPGAETATAADGTHPTGMHSCSVKISRKLQEHEEKWIGVRVSGGGGGRCAFVYKIVLCRSTIAHFKSLKPFILPRSTWIASLNNCSFNSEGGDAWQRGACVAKGDMCGKGECAWQGGMCVAKGGVCDKGSMCGKGACVPHTHTPQDTTRSYWNAYLFIHNF